MTLFTQEFLIEKTVCTVIKIDYNLDKDSPDVHILKGGVQSICHLPSQQILAGTAGALGLKTVNAFTGQFSIYTCAREMARYVLATEGTNSALNIEEAQFSVSLQNELYVVTINGLQRGTKVVYRLPIFAAIAQTLNSARGLSMYKEWFDIRNDAAKWIKFQTLSETALLQAVEVRTLEALQEDSLGLTCDDDITTTLTTSKGEQEPWDWKPPPRTQDLWDTKEVHVLSGIATLSPEKCAEAAQQSMVDLPLAGSGGVSGLIKRCGGQNPASRSKDRTQTLCTCIVG
ncbi:hypothetical protein M231_01917 [Tremella mesenterica]|uniref:Uncharacterized protein n=1 Tax=Tremella mesenterica TaxID=5217 RepID=A0A4Q1BSD8_TREME|nr:hypothetical protein M231_01917 [Tremella mesenterica]